MHRARTAVSAVTVTAMTLGLGAAFGPIAAARQAVTPAPSAVSAAAAAAARAAGGTAEKVIVLLRDQHAGLSSPEAAGASSPRAMAFTADQTPVVSLARAAGVRSLSQFTLINGFAASMTAAQQALLARNPAVSAVVPDLPIQRPVTAAPDGGTTPGAAAGTVDAAAAISSGACPANPSKPLLEPEALQTMHVAYDTNKVGAQSYTTGKGVKVAFMAEGLDVNNKDFIRPDGSHVIVDYKDFSGDGTSAPTGGGEAFGDASSIAAQGRYSYDLSNYASPAHPLPKGCTIKVRGVAPGVSMVALKVFGEQQTSTSGFVRAIQYAAQTAKVDVLNESFGGNPYPDRGTDPVSLANDAAVATGVTVVVSTGDAGTGNTIGSPSSDPAMISAGATTTFRLYAQISNGGITQSSGRWVDNNISSLSSGGATQGGRVPDVVAPGDLGWALCTPDLTLYADCADLQGRPTSLLEFGGTSEAAPLTAGTAALVIAAYAKTHHGRRPSPALVKRIIVSTAQDLGHPADLQGAGEVDALAAVRLARSVPTEGGASTAIPATAVGSALLVDHTQVDLTGAPGSTARGAVRVTNISKKPARVTATTRSLTKVVNTAAGAFVFHGSQLPTFPNITGTPRAYVTRTYHVGKGVDRLTTTVASPVVGPGYLVFFALISPTGVFSAYSLPQGETNFGRVDVRFPAAGTWKALIWANPAYTGRIAYRFTAEKFTTLGTASPGAFTLAPGASRTVSVAMPFASAPGDRFASLQLASSTGDKLSVPVSLRAVVPATAKRFSFTGVIDHGNGRAGGPAQSNTYYVDVPAGKPGLSVGVQLSGSSNELLNAFLVSPTGQPLSAQTNVRRDIEGNLVTISALQMFRAAPVPGRWTIVLAAANPLAGLQTQQAFKVSVGYGPADVAAVDKLPAGPATRLAAGSIVTRRIRITNNGVAPLIYFADPRRTGLVTYKLASQVAGDSLQSVSVPSATVPVWLVPTETRALSMHSRATVPVALDAQFEYNSPEKVGAVAKKSDVRFSDVALAAGPWITFLDQPGPFGAAGRPSGTTAVSAVVKTRAFDSAVLTSTGDLWRSALIPARAQPGQQTTGATAGSATGAVGASALSSGPWPGATSTAKGPLVLLAGQTGFISVTFVVRGKPGDVVRGTVFVDTADLYTSSGDEVAALPYGYTVR